MSFRYVEVKELGTTEKTDTAGHTQVISVLEGADGHVFGVLASYIEQGAGALRSPYGDYEYVFFSEETVWPMFEDNMGELVKPNEVEYVFDR